MILCYSVFSGVWMAQNEQCHEYYEHRRRMKTTDYGAERTRRSWGNASEWIVRREKEVVQQLQDSEQALAIFTAARTAVEAAAV